MFNKNHPQLRIAGPNCHLVRSKDIDEGVWFLDYPNGDFEDFAGGIRVVIDSFQMKAMDWIVNPPVVSTDKDSPCYKAIQLRSERDGEKCHWGPEYYLRINWKTPALLYLGNKSSRNLMSSIRIGGEYILLPQKRVHGKFIWYVPNVIDIEALDADNYGVQLN
jgi:hypothetical protein